MKNTAAAIVSLLASAASLAAAGTQAPLLPPALRGIGIEQKLGAQLPLQTSFSDEYGTPVRLASFFGRRPVLLALVYYQCPMLCSQILSGVVAGLRPLSLKSGRDFDVLAISFDPRDTPQTALEKREEYSRRYSRSELPAGWHFLTGSPESIRAITDAVGFHYRYDEKSGMFLHASGIMVLTPSGKVSRYFYGVEYQPKDLKLGLLESSAGTVGSPVDQILLFCYHYDPATGKYGAAVMNLLRATSLLVLIILAAALTILWRRDLRRDRQFLTEASPR